MAFLAGLVPKLASLAVQPAVLAAGVATGVAVGAVGVGTGAIPVTDPGPHRAPMYECPGSNRVVTSLAPNQNVLVTARSADGQWLQIYVGEAGADRGWAPASALQLKAAPDTLPVADCTPEATPEPLSSPPDGESSAAPPTDTPASLLPGPALRLYVNSPTGKNPVLDTYYLWRFGAPCPEAETKAFITVAGAGPDVIESITLHYAPTGGAEQVTSFTYASGYWDASFETKADWAYGYVTYWVEVRYLAGNTVVITAPAGEMLELAPCGVKPVYPNVPEPSNQSHRTPPPATAQPTKTPKPTKTPGPTPTPMLGPSITMLDIYQPPVDSGTGHYIIYPNGCTGLHTLAGMTVIVNDPDGIESVELFFRPTSGASLSSVFMQYEETDPLNNGKYDGQFGSNGSWGPGVVDWYIEAWDLADHMTRYDPTSSQVVELKYCSD